MSVFVWRLRFFSSPQQLVDFGFFSSPFPHPRVETTFESRTTARMSHQLVGESPFLKRVLIPFWIVRILILVGLVGIYGFLHRRVIAAEKNNLSRLYKDHKIDGDAVNAAIAQLCIMEAIFVLCLLFDIICIIKRARRTLLRPSSSAPTSSSRSSSSSASSYPCSPPGLACEHRPEHNRPVSAPGNPKFPTHPAFSSVLSANLVHRLSFLGLLIYASVIYHRFRKGTAPRKLYQARRPG